MISSAGIQKPTGAGTTRKIREQLNFTDERRWKQFSGRRLELIEKFKLSERKASEQDKNVSQIATILRTEFGYPLSSTPEFEKLVTAAVQSVRRNRKRSTKQRPSGVGADLLSATSLSPAPGFMDTPRTGDLLLDPHEHTGPSGTSSPSHKDSLQVRTSSLFTHSVRQHDPSIINSSTVQPPALPVIQPRRQHQNALKTSPLPPLVSTQNHHYDELIKTIIADAVHNRVSLHEQSQRDDYTPNLTDFALSSNDGELLNLAFQSQALTGSLYTTAARKPKTQADNGKIPFFLREKILLHIQRSRTCLELSSSQGSLELYSTLEILGDASIKASVAFVMERFFSNLSGPSMEYLTSKLSSASDLAYVAVKIFEPATEHHFEQLPRDAQLKLFNLAMGGIIKDFGFDPCVYPLSEIMHEVILKQYPLASQPNRECKRSAIMSTLSMAPASANKDVYRRVLLKFKDKEQRFTFHLLSNGPPSVAEVLANSRHLFQIVSQAKSLHLVHNNDLIRDDSELARIFNKFTSEEIVVEIREEVPESFNGLAMLSRVSASAFPHVEHTEFHDTTGPPDKSLLPSTSHDISDDGNLHKKIKLSKEHDTTDLDTITATLVDSKEDDEKVAPKKDTKTRPPLVFQPLL
ncbi:LAME_0F13784g1_1 [Lachancea meyersii CBS 8951]|uniref:LAME_0F13784g1_1 n=1 Tax=Lachancea meyersii CBS 8951 TaxID=1266667 RepID=A0A1G4JXM2_9SACH|nr:LAME_0F13784g1_1 [Lachancea meyersii CBS 8951]